MDKTLFQELNLYEIPLKAQSVNAAYKGRRYHTPEHKLFKEQCTILLNRLNLEKLCKKQEFYVIYRFHISANTDYDNCIKSFQDVLCNILGTDDRYIQGAYIRKVKAKKGDEKIEFAIFEYEYDLLQFLQTEI